MGQVLTMLGSRGLASRRADAARADQLCIGVSRAPRNDGSEGQGELVRDLFYDLGVIRGQLVLARANDREHTQTVASDHQRNRTDGTIPFVKDQPVGGKPGFGRNVATEKTLLMLEYPARLAGFATEQVTHAEHAVLMRAINVDNLQAVLIGIIKAESGSVIGHNLLHDPADSVEDCIGCSRRQCDLTGFQEAAVAV